MKAKLRFLVTGTLLSSGRCVYSKITPAWDLDRLVTLASQKHGCDITWMVVPIYLNVIPCNYTFVDELGI